ncbi:hypothetical protein M9H77_31196 [Catharanthus roseus]|uniref:Uncharacterized protein n=1 Tax=Catharanthus roseus TaxID=4058 RepID=A0ACB9ZZR0_CATRO|nr:hypothetical protein M9H77_31196 [Catharanthus roseus]
MTRDKVLDIIIWFGSVRGLYCMWLVPHTRASSDDMDSYRLLRVDPLKRRNSIFEGFSPTDIDDHLVESQEGLKIKLILKSSARIVFGLCTDYEMPELVSDLDYVC